jgi:hypothetical protein
MHLERIAVLRWTRCAACTLWFSSADGNCHAHGCQRARPGIEGMNRRDAVSGL